MRNLKNLVEELEELVNQNRSQLNTDALVEMELKVDQLKKEIDTANANRRRELAKEALELLGTLINIVTGVMTLLK